MGITGARMSKKKGRRGEEDGARGDKGEEMRKKGLRKRGRKKREEMGWGKAG